MQICLIRHAEAETIDLIADHDDSKRALTSKGLQECDALASALKKGGIELGTIVSSPYLRTLQTAERLRERWHTPLPQTILCDHLAPCGNVKEIRDFLLSLESKIVTVVGHMPDLAILGGWLIGSKKSQLLFEKSGAAWIDCGDEGKPGKGKGRLTWFLTPAWCQVISQSEISSLEQSISG